MIVDQSKGSTQASFPPIDFATALNDGQYTAVTAQPGPSLVLAGAGSGKTRILTYRVAYLLSQGIRPWEILLVTFTNKAAKEMLKRVEDLTGINQGQFWGGTFHAIGQRVLRTHGEVVGLSKDYTIIDASDAEALLKQVIQELDPGYLKEKIHPKAKIILEVISYARNTQQNISEVIGQRYPFYDDLASKAETFYKEYRRRKLHQQVADYDDLLAYWLQVLEQAPEVAALYQQRLKYTLVDEYQDTNKLQATILDLMSGNHQIMAVGDDAQCIYTWRGAAYENILSFPKRHPETTIHKIETNYRSTPEILQLANSIFRYQPPESGYYKELRAVRRSYQRPQLIQALDTQQQAAFILKRIEGLLDEGFHYSDIAILYRAHYQAMDIQIELSRQGLPFIITSGVRFFEQAHIRDLVAILRFGWNPQDEVAFARTVCLLPKVGPRSAERLYKLASQVSHKQGITLITALTHEQVVAKVPSGARGDWTDMALTWQNVEQALRAPHTTQAPDLLATPSSATAPFVPLTPDKVVQLAIEGWYGDYLRNIHTNWLSRQEDLDSVIGFAAAYDTMAEMLAQVVLLTTETGNRATPIDSDCIRMTTIHQAKGLEYPVVFLIGLADGLFPLKRAIEMDDLDEERRLFYVGVTRAKDELYLTYPMVALQGGPPQRLEISRFIREIPEEYYDALSMQRSALW